MVSRGFSSDSYPYEASENRVTEGGVVGRDGCAVFILSDHVPSGLWIARTIARRLHELATAMLDGWPSRRWLTVERIAVTEEQIADLGLPTRPTKQDGNSHARDWGDRPSVERDAIPSSTLREIVRDEIVSWIPPGALEEHEAQEARNREVLDIVRRAAAGARS